MRKLRANEPDLRNAAKASTQEVARLETALAGSEQTVGELQLSLEAALGEANRLLEDLTRALAEAELNRLRATPSAQVLDQLRAENARLRNKLDVERKESLQLRELNARRAFAMAACKSRHVALKMHLIGKPLGPRTRARQLLESWRAVESLEVSKPFLAILVVFAALLDASVHPQLLKLAWSLRSTDITFSQNCFKNVAFCSNGIVSWGCITA